VGCGCQLPNGLGTLQHGQTKSLFNVESVPCGQTCEATDPLTVRCENGLFKNANNLSEIVDFTNEPHSAFKFICAPATCNQCKVPDTGILVPHGEQHSFFKSATPLCGVVCESRSKRCENGIFKPEDPDFTQSSCAEKACSCPVPDNPNVTVSAGASWHFYSSNTATCGSRCVDISKARKCVENPEGSKTYSFEPDTTFTQSSCAEATGCSCALPGTLGSIQDKKTVILTNTSVVPCGKSCSEIPWVKLVCENGALYRKDDHQMVDPATFPYKYFCVQSVCADCRLPGYGAIANNTSITLYTKNVMGCADDPTLLGFVFECQNGVLHRNGRVYDPTTDPDAPQNHYTSYTLDCPGCDLPWGGKIKEDGTVNAYKYFGTVINNCGRGCKVTQRRCENGVLTGDSSYTLQDCSNRCMMEGGGAPPRGCLLPWQNSFITPDSVIPVWKKRATTCGDSCQNHFKLARCQMERGNFDVPFNYLYQACTELCP
jgi:hypothetical protein